jgi:hypothetical protein
MKFLRQLGAVTLLVAVVVVLGLAWNHFDPGSLIGGQLASVKQFSGPGGPTAGTEVLPGGAGAGGARGPVVVRSGPMNLGLSSMFEPINLAVLKHTVVIEGVVIALVVMIDVSRRLWRQERRARELAEPRAADAADAADADDADQ